MNKIQLIVTVAIVSFGIAHARAQGGYTLYNMQNVHQKAYLNPAIDPDVNFFVGIPALSGVYGGFENNAAPYSEAISHDNEGNALLDVGYIAENSKPDNYFALDLSVDLLNFGFRAGKNMLYFHAREVITTDFSYPQNFIKLLAYGNAPYSGERLAMDNFAYNFTSYREYAAGWSRSINDKLQLGARIKFLTGLENIRTVNSTLGLTTNPDNYHLTVDGSFDVRSSGINQLLNTEFKWQERLFTGQNRGAGIDLGAHYKATDKWTFSASVTDLGFIRWSRDIKSYNMNDTSFTFRGLNLNELVDDGEGSTFNRLADSLENTFDVNEDSSSYTSYLSSRFFLQARYTLTKNHSLSLLTHGTFINKKLNPAFSLAWNGQFGTVLGATLSYNAYGRNFTNIGAGITLRLGPAQLYAVTDNVLGFSGTSYSKNRHFRAGVNLVFGRKPEVEGGSD